MRPLHAYNSVLVCILQMASVSQRAGHASFGCSEQRFEQDFILLLCQP